MVAELSCRLSITERTIHDPSDPQVKMLVHSLFMLRLGDASAIFPRPKRTLTPAEAQVEADIQQEYGRLCRITEWIEPAKVIAAVGDPNPEKVAELIHWYASEDDNSDSGRRGRAWGFVCGLAFESPLPYIVSRRPSIAMDIVLDPMATDRASILDALEEKTVLSNLESIADLLDGPSIPVRRAVAIRLSELEAPQTDALLSRVMSNPYPGVRADAAYWICLKRDIRSATCRLAMRDTAPEVRKAVGYALRRSGKLR